MKRDLFKMFATPSARFAVIFMFCCGVFNARARVKTNTEVQCDRINSQQHYSLSDMTGNWYGIEILDHVNRGRQAADSCIKVQLKEMNNNDVQLIWTEQDFEVIYQFLINATRRSVWISLGPQTVRGNLGYQQFAGNVILLKASDSNAVLTFCSQPDVLYSLVLSKTHSMNETELDSIHSMVNRRVQGPFDIKKYCRNDATDLESVALLLVLSFTGVFIVRNSIYYT